MNPLIRRDGEPRDRETVRLDMNVLEDRNQLKALVLAARREFDRGLAVVVDVNREHGNVQA